MTKHTQATVPTEGSNTKFTAFRTQTLSELKEDNEWINHTFGGITDSKQELLLLVELARVKDDLKVAVATYKNDLPRLCEHLRVLDGILYRTLGAPRNPAWRTPRQKMWLLNQIVDSFSGLSAAIAGLKARLQLPIDEAVLAESAKRIQWAFDLNGPGIPRDEMRHREDDLLGDEGLKHAWELSRLDAYVSNLTASARAMPAEEASAALVTFKDIVLALKTVNIHISLKRIQNLFRDMGPDWGASQSKRGNAYLFKWPVIAPKLEKHFHINFDKGESLKRG